MNLPRANRETCSMLSIRFVWRYVSSRRNMNVCVWCSFFFMFHIRANRTIWIIIPWIFTFAVIRFVCLSVCLFVCMSVSFVSYQIWFWMVCVRAVLIFIIYISFAVFRYHLFLLVLNVKTLLSHSKWSIYVVYVYKLRPYSMKCVHERPMW